MDHLGVLAHGEIDYAAKTFFRLFGYREPELMQGERVVLVVEYSCRNRRTFNIPVRMRIPSIDIPAHADPRRFENLVESRGRGGFGLGEDCGRGCEQRGYGRSGKKVFHCLTLLFGVGGPRPFSTARARIFISSFP